MVSRIARILFRNANVRCIFSLKIHNKRTANHSDRHNLDFTVNIRSFFCCCSESVYLLFFEFEHPSSPVVVVIVVDDAHTHTQTQTKREIYSESVFVLGFVVANAKSDDFMAVGCCARVDHQHQRLSAK